VSCCTNPSFGSTDAAVTTPPRSLRGAGTLRRLRSTGALRGLEAGLDIDDSLRKLHS
jgi:hypothetical protein